MITPPEGEKLHAGEQPVGRRRIAFLYLAAWSLAAMFILARLARQQMVSAKQS
jgi:hypothetical protein